MAPSSESINYMIHHVILPAQLPESNDYNVAHEDYLLNTVLGVLRGMMIDAEEQHAEALGIVIQAMKSLQYSRNDMGIIGERKARRLLEELLESDVGTAIPLFVNTQNAAVLISRGDDSIIFEAFELHPKNSAAMSVGRLRRIFPGAHGVEISTKRMQQENLMRELTTTLARMSKEEAKAFQLESNRDTPHPGMVTDYFLKTISALGKAIETSCVKKNTREEVIHQPRQKPWQRSSLWLLIRVTLQLLFNRNGSSIPHGVNMYKVFMILLLTRILELTEDHVAEFGCEMMHMVSAKIVRRLRKLKKTRSIDFCESLWVTRVEDCLRRSHDIVASHWHQIQKSTTPKIDATSLQEVCPEKCLDMRLSELSTFLAAMTSRAAKSTPKSFQPLSRDYSFSPTDLPTGFGEIDDYTTLRLAAVEVWVEAHITSWVIKHFNDPPTCRKLSTLMKDYFETAKIAYAEIPNSHSEMHLTILKIWKTCDELVVSTYPLLKDYSPEIYVEHLQQEHLPQKRQMERLREFEKYIQTRQDMAVKSNPSIYRDFGHKNSFAVKFYHESAALQTLMSEIERAAALKRSATLKNFVELKEQYDKLMKDYWELECELETHAIEVKNIPEGAVHHSRYCARCAVKRKANNLKIAVHEWPISRNRSIAAATIFELKIPEAIGDWRDASMFLIVDVFKYQGTRPTQSYAHKNKFKYTLETHHNLSHMITPRHKSRRIVLASDAKPHTPTFRKIAKLNSVGDVCVENGLRYAYYDQEKCSYIVKLEPSNETAQGPSYRMPDLSKSLERYLLRRPNLPDGISPNEPIVSFFTSKCPKISRRSA